MKTVKSLFALFLIIVFLLETTDAVQACDTASANILWKDYNEGICFEDSSAESGVYTVNYILNGGVNIWMNPVVYEKEDLPITLYVPARSGYNFAGWYLESNYKTKVTELTEDTLGDVVLFAKWTKVIDDEDNVQMYSYKTSSMISGTTDKELKNCDYSFLQYINIPGMPSTREEDRINNRIADTNQCPQGICVTDDYVMVTAYSSGKDTVGSLHVFDKETGEYLVTLGMKKESHLGGITFDGNYIWVCHSDNQTLERIPYGFVTRLAEQKLKICVDCTDSITDFKVNNRPSCISYYNGKLYVATETTFFNSKMIAYEFDGSELKETAVYRIPNKVQGVAFDENGTVYLSTSYGRTNSSYLKVYESLADMDSKPAKPYVKVEMPPCSEEVEITEGNIYVLFESAGSKYFEGTDGNGTSVSPLDKILAINLNSF